MSASQPSGPWSLALLPDSLLNLPPGEMWNPVQKAAKSWNPSPTVLVPRVFYSATAAELVLFNGEQTYDSIPGTTLE